MLHAYCRKISTEVDKILMMTQDKDYFFPKNVGDIQFFSNSSSFLRSRIEFRLIAQGRSNNC